jgi:hypothetical protein
MKTLSLSKNILPTILFLCLVFFACKKETSQNDLTAQEEEEASLAISESEAESEIMFNDIFDNVMGANNDVYLLIALLQKLQGLPGVLFYRLHAWFRVRIFLCVLK